MKIKKGDKFKCVKDYIMDDNSVAFTIGKKYKSLKDDTLPSFDKFHDLKDETNLNKYFKKVKKKTKKDSIVYSVRKQLLDRSNVGIKKYGVTLDREDLSLIEWLEHTKQEQMDSVLYLEKAIQQLKRQNENIDSKSSILFGQPNLKIEFPHRQS